MAKIPTTDTIAALIGYRSSSNGTRDRRCCARWLAPLLVAGSSVASGMIVSSCEINQSTEDGLAYRGNNDLRQVSARLDEPVLCLPVARDWVRGAQGLVVEVSAGRQRQRFVADRQPDLSEVGFAHVIRRTGTTHTRRHLAGFERIGPNLRPASSDAASSTS
jgi:hypothetical protein